VCKTSMCNEHPIGAQLATIGMVQRPTTRLWTAPPGNSSGNGAPPPTPLPAQTPAAAAAPARPRSQPDGQQLTPNQQIAAANGTAPDAQSRLCFVCGESDLAYPSDCARTYEYDCSRQYPGRNDVLCMTRLTKTQANNGSQCRSHNCAHVCAQVNLRSKSGVSQSTNTVHNIQAIKWSSTGVAMHGTIMYSTVRARPIIVMWAISRHNRSTLACNRCPCRSCTFRFVVDRP